MDFPSRNCGVYSITNKINGKRYIGSSIDMFNRVTTHKSALNCHKHAAENLQADWITYGKDNFKFEPIIYCSNDNRLFYEELILVAYDSSNPEKGYNIRYFKDGKHCIAKKTKEKLSAINTGAPGPNKGRKFSEEARLHMSLARKGKPNPKMSTRWNDPVWAAKQRESIKLGLAKMTDGARITMRQRLVEAAKTKPRAK